MNRTKFNWRIKSFQVLLLLCGYFASFVSLSYETDTHEALTAKAYDISLLASMDFERRFDISTSQLFQPFNTENMTAA